MRKNRHRSQVHKSTRVADLATERIRMERPPLSVVDCPRPGRSTSDVWHSHFDIDSTTRHKPCLGVLKLECRQLGSASTTPITPAIRIARELSHRRPKCFSSLLNTGVKHALPVHTQPDRFQHGDERSRGGGGGLAAETSQTRPPRRGGARGGSKTRFGAMATGSRGGEKDGKGGRDAHSPGARRIPRLLVSPGNRPETLCSTQAPPPPPATSIQRQRQCCWETSRRQLRGAQETAWCDAGSLTRRRQIVPPRRRPTMTARRSAWRTLTFAGESRRGQRRRRRRGGGASSSSTRVI
ncbi:hypothetical protein LX36DRAFT_463623 [Colletotrichum falcatum]|nr:hypothetical protein LX36DRAFT_463623 [Colletotrichum falcatum]